MMPRKHTLQLTPLEALALASALTVVISRQTTRRTHESREVKAMERVRDRIYLAPPEFWG